MGLEDSTAPYSFTKFKLATAVGAVKGVRKRAVTQNDITHKADQMDDDDSDNSQFIAIVIAVRIPLLCKIDQLLKRLSLGAASHDA